LRIFGRSVADLHAVIDIVVVSAAATIWPVPASTDVAQFAPRPAPGCAVRDAALIGIMASRGPRLRAGGGIRLRHLRRVGEHWHLYFDAGLMKGGRSRLELPLSARVAAIVARYIAVERQELLRGATHDMTSSGCPARAARRRKRASTS
jgi:hypothetical protein